MKTIAMVTSGAATVPNFRSTLIEELCRRGHRVLALAPDWSDDLSARTAALGAEPVDISLSRTGIGPIRDLLDCARLVATFRRLKPDAVLTYFAKPNVYGMLAARIAGVRRRIAMVEGLGFAFDSSDDDRRRRPVQIVAERLFRIAFSGAHRVVFLNPDDEAFFRDRRLVASAKVVNIGGIGVDLEEFAPAAPVIDPVTFLLMARLLRGKGILEFAAAAAKVKARRPAARFVLLGAFDANPDSLSRQDIQPWVDSGVIEWPGHVHDVRGYLANSSVFVLPAWCREGMPRSSQEASAMGKPVITTGVVGCRETVRDGVTGLIVRPRDVDDLVRAMIYFVENPREIERMGREGRRFAELHYDGRAKSRLLADLLLR